MAIQEGDKIPEATVHHMTDTGPTPITTSAVSYTHLTLPTNSSV